MAVGEVRPGYELWRPNREKAETKTTKFVIAVLLLATAGIGLLIAIGGFGVLQGGAAMGVATVAFCLLYIFFAFMVVRWNRGVLPIAAALSVLLLIFAGVGAASWFARDKSGFETTLLPTTLIGLLVVILIPLSILVVVVGMIGFNQEWHVEEERPIGESEDYGAGSGPPDGDGELAERDDGYEEREEAPPRDVRGEEPPPQPA